jgi:nitrite reductase/ring-hydroxylating ferredoxin subunit
MELHKVAKTTEFVDLKPIFVDVSGIRIALYLFHERYYAYANHCPHQAGPACEGVVVGNVETEIASNGRVREYVSKERQNIACPWHGMEFDLETGVCRADRRYRLQAYEVVVEGDYVLVKK